MQTYLAILNMSDPTLSFAASRSTYRAGRKWYDFEWFQHLHLHNEGALKKTSIIEMFVKTI